MGTGTNSTIGAVRGSVYVRRRSASAATAPQNSRARSAFRWYAWLLLDPTRSLSATIRVRYGDGVALVPELVPHAAKLHQVMHAHYLLVLGVPPAASTHRTPLLHAALHAARFHGSDSGHHLSVCVSSSLPPQASSGDSIYMLHYEPVEKLQMHHALGLRSRHV